MIYQIAERKEVTSILKHIEYLDGKLRLKAANRFDNIRRVPTLQRSINREQHVLKEFKKKKKQSLKLGGKIVKENMSDMSEEASDGEQIEIHRDE